MAFADWSLWLAGGLAEQPELRPNAYETIASCGNTNVGGGILAANNALTDPIDVRREAVWVMIVLSDGAANVTNEVPDVADETTYGYWGYCPWWTFCYLDEDHDHNWPECTENNPSQTERALPICNDNNPDSRHFCIDWDTGLPDQTEPTSAKPAMTPTTTRAIWPTLPAWSSCRRAARRATSSPCSRFCLASKSSASRRRRR
ncbi:MAG: hypothetical protein M5U29_18505 [Anaerolineae bacterium]|nr:hypothetical protein [Anaerolineae bacterium]